MSRRTSEEFYDGRYRQTRREVGTQSYGPLLRRGGRVTERSLMQPPQYRSFAALEVLATSLVMRLSLNELEWLWRELAQRTQEKRRKECNEGFPSVTVGS
jgi:hypothetical protein